jgi:hypothetical protein
MHTKGLLLPSLQSGYGKHFKWPREIQYLNFIEQENTHIPLLCHFHPPIIKTKAFNPALQG